MRPYVSMVWDKLPYEMKQLLVHNVMFYIFPPLIQIPLAEFEDLAMDRLKMLRIVESASAKYTPMTQEWKDSVLREMLGDGLKIYTRLFKGNGSTPADMEARRKDYLSHFILRFAYCQNEELRRWFTRHEVLLFRFKFSELSKSGVAEFKEAYNLSYKTISPEEKREIRDGLFESTREESMFKIEEMDFYKVPFTEVLNLVANKHCFVQKGFAYVSTVDFVHIVSAIYENLTVEGLFEQLKILPYLECEERLVDVMKKVNTTNTGKDYALGENDVAIENLDQLSKKSYPLCMRMAHEHLRATHKLKHNGRLQYGLFLKGIGVTLEDSLRFWRAEFCKVVDPDKFEKEYSYNIRYNYGKEGSRTNWTPWSCMKVINSASTGGDCSGCPYKLYSPADLKPKLMSYGLSNLHAQEVVEYAQKGHYQLACGKYFDITHNHKLDQGINHPNSYFQMSQEVMGARQPKKAPATPNTPASTQKQRKELILKKKRMHQQMNDEDDAELLRVSQIEEAAYFAKTNQKLPENGVEEQKSSDGKENNATANNMSSWDDDDFDVSLLDESIAMQY